MPRRPGRATGQFVFHVLNRAVQNTTLFETRDDYREFFRLVCAASDRVPMRLLTYALMPNHWHVVLWPLRDNDLSAFMRWLTARHAEAWRVRRGTRGRGAVYQSRFKAIAVQCDDHFLRLCRYVERNPVRARLVVRAEDWEWSAASPAAPRPGRPALTAWPVPKPSGWQDAINVPERPRSLDEIRHAIKRGRHFGDRSWRLAAIEALGWRSGRGQGRPRTTDEATRPAGTTQEDNSVIRLPA
jgi:REP-associated tyrosine transposase